MFTCVKRMSSMGKTEHFKAKFETLNYLAFLWLKFKRTSTRNFKSNSPGSKDETNFHIAFSANGVHTTKSINT